MRKGSMHSAVGREKVSRVKAAFTELKDSSTPIKAGRVPDSHRAKGRQQRRGNHLGEERKKGERVRESMQRICYFKDIIIFGFILKYMPCL